MSRNWLKRVERGGEERPTSSNTNYNNNNDNDNSSSSSSSIVVRYCD